MKTQGSAPSKANRFAWRSGLAWAKVAISIGLLWLLFSTYDFGTAAHRLVDIDLRWLGVSAIVYSLLVLVATWRWRVILAALGEGIAFSSALGIIAIGLFFNQVIPSNLSGDAMRIWRLHKLGAGLGRSVGSVMLDRVIAILALAVMVLVMLPVSAHMIGNAMILAAFGLFIAATFVAIALILWLDRVVFVVGRILPGRAIDALSALARDSRTVLLNRINGIVVVLLAIANHILFILMMMALARGLGIQTGFVEFLILVPPVMFASVLPLSFAGWGVREGAMVAMFGTVGVAANEALALSVTFGLVALVGSLPGGAIWLATGNRNGR